MVGQLALRELSVVAEHRVSNAVINLYCFIYLLLAGGE
jgi:hypothetical protein